MQDANGFTLTPRDLCDLLTSLYLGDIGVVAVCVLGSMILHKGIVNPHPDLVPLRRELSDLKAVGAVLCLVMGKKVSNILPVVRMDRAHGPAALGSDEVLLRSLHHLRKFLGTPDRVVCAIRLHLHHNRIIIQRIKEPLVKFRFKSFHDLPPLSAFFFIYLPDFILKSAGLWALTGIAQIHPNSIAPSIRPSLQSLLMRLCPMPHLADASEMVIYPSIFHPH